MKLSSLALALLAVAASPTLVASEADPQETSLQPVRAVLAPPKAIGGYKALKLLALETDLTTHDVRLVLTTEVRNARYDFRSDLNKARQFESSLGSERFSDLIAGRPIELHSPAGRSNFIRRPCWKRRATWPRLPMDGPATGSSPWSCPPPREAHAVTRKPTTPSAPCGRRPRLRPSGSPRHRTLRCRHRGGR